MDILNNIDVYLNENEMEEDGDFEFVLTSLVYELLDKLDFDSLSEDQLDIIDEILELTDDSNVDEEDGDELDEKMKMVVRAGKRMRKLDCPDGKKALNGKCVRITPQEIRARKKAAKKAAKKRKGGKAKMAAKKRARSMKKR